MESLSSNSKDTALHILNRIEEAINTVQARTQIIRSADDFLLSPEGREKLDAACMVIEAIGESFKNLDKVTDFELLPLYPSIEWKEVKGVRDVIAHHYFDIDANEIFGIINNDLESLKEAIRYFREVLNK
ncbi:MAG: DUF86 domain-containing protein [Prevotella sp.]|nr:DUF86 domain-containing protein [Prevotella sp.]